METENKASILLEMVMKIKGVTIEEIIGKITELEEKPGEANVVVRLQRKQN